MGNPRHELTRAEGLAVINMRNDPNPKKSGADSIKLCRFGTCPVDETGIIKKCYCEGGKIQRDVSHYDTNKQLPRHQKLYSLFNRKTKGTVCFKDCFELEAHAKSKMKERMEGFILLDKMSDYDVVANIKEWLPPHIDLFDNDHRTSQLICEARTELVAAKGLAVGESANKRLDVVENELETKVSVDQVELMIAASAKKAAIVAQDGDISVEDLRKKLFDRNGDDNGGGTNGGGTNGGGTVVTPLPKQVGRGRGSGVLSKSELESKLLAMGKQNAKENRARTPQERTARGIEFQQRLRACNPMKRDLLLKTQNAIDLSTVAIKPVEKKKNVSFQEQATAAAFGDDITNSSSGNVPSYMKTTASSSTKKAGTVSSQKKAAPQSKLKEPPSYSSRSSKLKTPNKAVATPTAAARATRTTTRRTTTPTRTRSSSAKLKTPTTTASTTARGTSRSASARRGGGVKN